MVITTDAYDLESLIGGAASQVSEMLCVLARVGAAAPANGLE